MRHMKRTWATAAVTAALALAAAGCSTSDGSTTTADAATAGEAAERGGIQPGYALDEDRFSPLIITSLAPDPIPFTGSDGKVHVAYELQVINFSPRPATITRIETLADGPDGPVVTTFAPDEITPRTVLVADYPSSPTPVTQIPPGRVALLVLDATFDTRDDVPSVVTHRLTASFGDVASDQREFASRYPTEVTQLGGEVRTSSELPVVIGPPLAGTGWWVANGCCGVSPHRAGLLPVGGRINGVERYALDLARLDTAAPALFDPETGQPATFRDDDTVNANYLAYGEKVLAVADGTVVASTVDQPDATPQHLTPGLPLDHLGGNHLIIDIGDGNYAFYGHLQPDSPRVKVGDRVTRGQTIALLGNSGNTTEAHLHFHVTRAPTPLSGDNVPFEIDTFTFVGTTHDGRLEAGPDAGRRTDQLPLNLSLVDFPPAP